MLFFPSDCFSDFPLPTAFQQFGYDLFKCGRLCIYYTGCAVSWFCELVFFISFGKPQLRKLQQFLLPCCPSSPISGTQFTCMLGCLKVAQTLSDAQFPLLLSHILNLFFDIVFFHFQHFHMVLFLVSTTLLKFPISSCILPCFL